MKKRWGKTLIISALSVVLTSSFALCDKQEFVMDDNQAISVDVSREGLSSLSIKGDRIKEVLGLSEDVTVEKDEANGLLFLKGLKNKEQITLLTEGGEMQDVILKPSNKGSTRVIFSIKKTSEIEPAQTEPHFSFQKTYQNISSPIQNGMQDNVISLMKHITLGNGATLSSMNRSQKEGFSITPLRVCVDQKLQAEVYAVKNMNENTTHVLEKDFYERGDVAISLSKRQVKAGETFYLYVVRASV